MVTELYSEEQAKLIISFYQDKLIGKVINESNRIVVSSLDTEKFEKGLRIICRCKIISGGFVPILSIESVLEILNLPQPKTIFS